MGTRYHASTRTTVFLILPAFSSATMTPRGGAEVGGKCARGERGGRGSIWRRGRHSQHPRPAQMSKHSSAKQEVGTLAEYRRPRRHCATK